MLRRRHSARHQPNTELSGRLEVALNAKAGQEVVVHFGGFEDNGRPRRAERYDCAGDVVDRADGQVLVRVDHSALVDLDGLVETLEADIAILDRGPDYVGADHRDVEVPAALGSAPG